MATQILVGFFKGAGLNEEVDRRVKFTISIATLLSGSIALLLYQNEVGDYVLPVSSSPEIHALGRKILFIEIFLEIGRAVNMSMVMALNAAGDVKFPINIGIIFMWSVAVAGSWLLGVHWGWGLVGIWIAMMCDECIRALLFLIRWKQGVWRKAVV